MERVCSKAGEGDLFGFFYWRSLTIPKPFHTVDYMTFLFLKWVHILSAMLLIGTGLGSAFYVWRANRAGNLQAIRFMLKNVILADWLFTVPPIILLPVTGLWLMRVNGYMFSTLWLWVSMVLFIITGLCWIPAAILQYKMKALADQTFGQEKLPTIYWKYERTWFCLGIAAFPPTLVIISLMIFKPV